MKLDDFQMTNLLMKMYEKSAEAIFFFDRNGNVMTMNHSAKQILNVDVISRMVEGEENAICFTCKGYTNEQDLKTCVSCYLFNPQEDFSSFQVYLDTRGKGIIPYAASFQTIDEENGIRIFMLRDSSKQFKTQEVLNQKTMMKSVLKAQEDERKRISRELHDGVAQEMLSALVDLRVLKYMNIDDDVKKKVQQAESSITRVLDDIRHLAVELRPATLDDLGLEAAFRTHFKWTEKNYGLLVEFTAELKAKRYEGEIETVVYRVCQEAVLNALKYAETEVITVRLFEDAEKLKLHVVDKGIGFEIDYRNEKGTGLGLYGMRERAELVGGQLLIQTEIDGGTHISLEIPLSTNTGRQHYYIDHELFLEFGEALPVYKPTLPPMVFGPRDKKIIGGQDSLVLRYLTPHGKWNIHSTYQDNQHMLTLFRGGPTVWISDLDAAEHGIEDNVWLEVYNRNGVVTARSVVSHRMPKGTMFMYHAQDKHIQVPGSEITDERGGSHNAPTRIHMKPTQMVGGYAQLSYGFNYYGPIGNQRDEYVAVRKMGEVDWLED